MNAIIDRIRAPRTLWSQVLRLVLPRAAAFAVVAGVLFVGNVMAVTPSSAPYRLPATVAPVWTLAEQAAEPDCVPLAEWPEGVPGTSLVVHRFRDKATVRLPFMTAWKANHNDTDVDDLHVLGVCA